MNHLKHARTLALMLTVAMPAGLTGSATAKAPETARTLRQARLAEVILQGALPVDLVRPEGKTRWDLTSLKTRLSFVESLVEVENAGQGAAEHGYQVSGEGSSPMTFTDTDSVSARRWLEPQSDREKLRPGTRETMDLFEARGATEDRLRIESEIVGIGWVHLPSGPHEAVLQRARVTRDPGGDRVIYRWIDPREGVIVETSGRSGIDEARVVEKVLLGAANLVLYVSDLDGPQLTYITYGRNRGAGTTVASLTPAGHTTIGNLLAADTWDFSGNTTGIEIASTTVPMGPTETCNTASCGYNLSTELARDDIGFLDADASNDLKNNTVTVTEQRAGDVTIWLRAGTQHETKSSGALGESESRFCYEGTAARNAAPLYRFIHQDATGWFMQPGDPDWAGGPGGTCQQTIFNCVCGSCGGFAQQLWTKSCTSGGSNYSGTQGGGVVKTGVVTVPSGHTFNAMILKNLAEFCVYLGSSCSSLIKVQDVRTVSYLWQVPVIGTAVRLQSAQNAADQTSFTTVDETNIVFGLFPPRSITAGTTTNTTINLSWDPGLDTHRISSYKIYWDTDSGSVNSYAFNSVANAGQVSFAGTSATISGLTPGTTYYVTVTSRSIYTDPSSGVVTTYESILYPTQVSGDPSFVYPTEVQATTTSPTCIPTAEVANLTVNYNGPNFDFCWDAVTDPCLQGYRLLGANSPESPANFTTVTDVGTGTICFTGAPAQGFFLVKARGTGGTGP